MAIAGCQRHDFLSRHRDGSSQRVAGLTHSPDAHVTAPGTGNRCRGPAAPLSYRGPHCQRGLRQGQASQAARKPLNCQSDGAAVAMGAVWQQGTPLCKPILSTWRQRGRWRRRGMASCPALQHALSQGCWGEDCIYTHGKCQE
jgi:hypothetical protein